MVMGLRAEGCAEQARHVRAALAAGSVLEAKFVDEMRVVLEGAAVGLDQVGAGWSRMREILIAYGDEITEFQRLAALIRGRFEDAYHSACSLRAVVCADEPAAQASSPSWDVLPPREAVGDSGSYWGRWSMAIEEVAEAQLAWTQLMERRQVVDTQTAQAFRSIDVVEQISAGWGTIGVSTPALVGVAAALWSGNHAAITPADLAGLDDATTVRKAWDMLGEVDRQRLLTEDPKIMGNLNGIPLMFRVQANQAAMRAELERALVEREAVRRRLDEYRGHGRFSQRGRIMAELKALDTRIATYRKLLDPPNPRHESLLWYDKGGKQHFRDAAQVVVFDPDHEAIGIYHGAYDSNGDIPAWMDNVVVHVPGTGTNIDKFYNPDARATDMYMAAHDSLYRDGGDPGGRTAVVAWAGGELPQLLDAAESKYSRDLAPKLRDFTAAIDLHKESTLTVTGHSYGATVVSMAEKSGLRADRILYVSSAGLGNDVKSISEFPYTAKVPHYSMMARNDPIVGWCQDADLGDLGLGKSPLDAKGIVRLETGFIDRTKPELGHLEDNPGAHSTVYGLKSTSFRNIVNVLIGGQVETWVPDKVVTYEFRGGADVVQIYTDGVDADGYRPDYVEVK